jgi:hypothetical protein
VLREGQLVIVYAPQSGQRSRNMALLFPSSTAIVCRATCSDKSSPTRDRAGLLLGITSPRSVQIVTFRLLADTLPPILLCCFWVLGDNLLLELL